MDEAEKVINYLNAIMALAKQSNDENTDAIVMLALEAQCVLSWEETKSEN